MWYVFRYVSQFLEIIYVGLSSHKMMDGTKQGYNWNSESFKLIINKK